MAGIAVVVVVFVKKVRNKNIIFDYTFFPNCLYQFGLAI